MTAMPPLETPRLIVRPLSLADLDAVHGILDVELAEADFGSEGARTVEARREWLAWTIMSYEQYAGLYQPPYGERAVILKETGTLIGLCGFVPCLNSFEQLPGLSPFTARQVPAPNTAEVGLFYAISPAYQKQGYATEAAGVMVEYAFQRLRLKRIVATTARDNAGSMAVMRKLGMRIARNPHPDPPWLQVVGVLENSHPDSIP